MAGLNKNLKAPHWFDYLAGEERSIANAITNILFAPCDTPPSLWVATALPAAIEAMWSILSPDPKEMYHMLAGQSLKHTLQEEIEAAHTEKSVFSEGALKKLFKVAEWADMTVWYAFLASVAESGMLNWTTQVSKLSGCQNTTKGHIESSWVSSASEANEWTSPPFVFTDGHGGSYVGQAAVEVPKNKSGIIAVHTTAMAGDGQPVAADTRIIDADDGTVFDVGWGAEVTKDGIVETGRTMTFAQFPPDSSRSHYYMWQTRYDGQLPWPGWYGNTNPGGYVGVV